MKTVRDKCQFCRRGIHLPEGSKPFDAWTDDLTGKEHTCPGVEDVLLRRRESQQKPKPKRY